MFGYVIPAATGKDFEDKYRTLYCGLCHSLKESYGLSGEMILSFDFVFLAALLGAPFAIERSRCLKHPIHKQDYLASSDILHSVATDCVILTYWQWQDKYLDEDFLKKTASRVFLAVLSKAYDKARSLHPGFADAVEKQLSLLHKYEESRSSHLDAVSDCFAVMLQSVLENYKDRSDKRILEQILYHLGRWIYLIDAVDDFPNDIRQKNYNPIQYRFQTKVLDDKVKDELRLILTPSIESMQKAYQLGDFGPWQELLENILYYGIPTVSQKVFDGSFHSSQRFRKVTI